MTHLFVDEYPELASKIVQLTTSSMKLEEVASGSALKALLKGDCGHIWEQALRNAARRGATCPYCFKRKVLKGFNDVQTALLEGNYSYTWGEKEIQADSVSKHSNSKYNWHCNTCNFNFVKTPASLFQNNVKCPVCNNKQVLKGVNDLATTHPHLLEEWDNEKNTTSTPYNVVAGSGKKVWWKCKENHSWEVTIVARSQQNTGCPFCKNRKVLVGFNDLATTHPHLLEEWDYSKNVVKPTEVTAGSETVIWWLCAKGHSQSMLLYSKTSRNSKCVVCLNRVIVKGVNDLATTHPHLLREWDYTKNTKSPEEISAGSDLRTWWICEKGHSWECHTYHRGSEKNPTFCPSCTTPTSLQEDALVNYVKSILIGIKMHLGDRTILGQKEVDIYIPEKNIAIEYNGMYWHSDKVRKNNNYHFDKYQKCKDKGIQLIQVWEDDWNRNPELVKRMLAYKLGVAQERKVFARNTVVKALTQSQSNEFLDEYHIQGAVDGGIRVGLFETGGDIEKPVAVMVLKREPGTEGKTLNLLRYATSMSVVGGFTKLLKHVEQEYAPASIVTFSDNCVSDGGLYEKHGFMAVKELKPDYMYVVKGERVHKFNYRLKRFREDPELQYVEGLGERELAVLNKISRVWDAGKVKWERTF